MTAEGQPHPSDVTLEELANTGRVKVKLRRREEWLERIQPHMEDFLPEPMQQIARVRIEQYLESIADFKPKRPDRDGHRSHFYLLKGILRTKQGNHPMTGGVGGKKGKERRSYAVARGESVPRTVGAMAGRAELSDGSPLPSSDSGVAIAIPSTANVSHFLNIRSPK